MKAHYHTNLVIGGLTIQGDVLIDGSALIEVAGYTVEVFSGTFLEF